MDKRFKVVADLDLSGRGQVHPPSLILDETEAQRVLYPLLTVRSRCATLKCIIVFILFTIYFS